jgi:hypothetical protein
MFKYVFLFISQIMYVSSIFGTYPISYNLQEELNNTCGNTCDFTQYSSMENTLLLAKEYGIDIIREYSEEAMDIYILGGYRPILQQIVLYNVPKLGNFSKINKQTLKHELIHAIQHCKGNKKLFEPLLEDRSIETCISQNWVNTTFIKSFYSKEDVDIEIEAYCLEKIISYGQIDILLNRYC